MSFDWLIIHFRLLCSAMAWSWRCGTSKAKTTLAVLRAMEEAFSDGELDPSQGELSCLDIANIYLDLYLIRLTTLLYR